MNKLSLLLVFATGLALVEPNGFVLTPLARTSVHRLPNWGGAQQPFWWDDTNVWCGNVHQSQYVPTCGRCGDAPGNSHTNRGGRYDKAIITGTYNAGQIIDVTVRVVTNRRGNFIFELCNLNDDENNTCFQRLPIVGGTQPIRPDGSMMCILNPGNIDMTARLQLPAGFRCTRCTLRWTYRASLPPAPDACFDPNPVETFRNCVDIRIY